MEHIISTVAAQYLLLYGGGTAERTALHDTSHGETDLRCAAIFEYPDGGKIVVKVTKNSFTTPERVLGWASLIEHYNDLGIYAPRMLKNVSGEYVAECDGFVCYAEEFMDGVEVKWSLAGGYHRETPSGTAALETIGLAAANPAPLAPWPTAWCLYDKFAPDDPCDERYEYAQWFARYFAENLPKHAERAAAILREYERLRAEFEPEYRSLPKAVFQGDVMNYMVTPDGDFRGLFDFNLSGTETALNYAFCESHSSLYYYGKRTAENILDRAELDGHDERMSRFLAHTLRHYKLSDAEKRAFARYYQIARPFFQMNKDFMRENLTEHGELYADTILTWVEYQMSRRGADVLLP